MDDYIIEYKWMIIGDVVNHSSGKPKNKTAISERFLFQIKFRIGFLGGLTTLLLFWSQPNDTEKGEFNVAGNYLSRI
jgi:hypothetical protein